MVQPTWDSETGLAHVADLLTADECTTLIATCQRLFNEQSGQHPRDKPASGTRHLEELHCRVPLVAELLERPALTDLVAEALGLRAPAPSQVSLRSPGPGYGGQDLHRDASDSLQGPRPTVLTAIVALVDFTSQNGATRVVPGSHLTNQLPEHYRGRAAPRQVVLTGSAGTAFVFTGHLLHSGTENRSDQPRPALQIVWR